LKPNKGSLWTMNMLQQSKDHRPLENIGFWNSRGVITWKLQMNNSSLSQMAKLANLSTWKTSTKIMKGNTHGKLWIYNSRNGVKMVTMEKLSHVVKLKLNSKHGYYRWQVQTHFHRKCNNN
jgi:hypothetical protein